MTNSKRIVLGRIGAVVLAAAGLLTWGSPARADYVYTLQTTTAFGVPFPIPPGVPPGSPSGSVPSDFVLTTLYDTNPATQTLSVMSSVVLSPQDVRLDTFFTEVGHGTFTASDGILSGTFNFSGDEQEYSQLQINDNMVFFGVYQSDPNGPAPPCATSSSGEQFFGCIFFGNITARYVNTPEPASIGLFSIGLLGLMTARPRVRRNRR